MTHLEPLTKSPKPYRCMSRECRDLGQTGVTLYLLSQREPCPRCNEKGYLSPLEIIHLIHEVSPTQGLSSSIKGSGMFHNQHRHYEFMCESSKIGFKQPYKTPNHPKSYTLVPSSATCHDCLLAYGAKLTGHTITVE